jgi:hypothetical protein
MLFFDVDGVLNFPAYPFKEYIVTIETAGRAKNAFTKNFSDEYVDIRVRFHTALPAWLAELGEVFELAWATTWGHQANTYLSPLLGLGDLPVVEFNEPNYELVRRNYIAEWKWDNIVPFAGGRPFVFVDDRAARVATNFPMRLGATQAALDAPMGLTREHVDALLRFAATLAPGVAHHGP